MIEDNYLEDLLVKFREASQTRIHHRLYYELLLITYHQALLKTLDDETRVKVYDALVEGFKKAIEEVKKKPMLSPLN